MSVGRARSNKCFSINKIEGKVINMNKVITTKDNRGNTMRIFDLGETVQISFNGGLVDLNKGELIKILQTETPTYNEQISNRG